MARRWQNPRRHRRPAKGRISILLNVQQHDTQALIKEWAGEEVLIRFDQPTGAWLFIALHSTKLGPATGGTRMKQYPNWHAALADALLLSAGMTNKFAVAGFPRGG